MHLLMYIGMSLSSASLTVQHQTVKSEEVARCCDPTHALNPDGKELEVTEVLNKIVDSIEAELSAIALSLEASFEYLMQLDHPNSGTAFHFH